MHRTSSLASSPLFQQVTESLPPEERIRISYERAKAIAQVYSLTADDVLHLSPKCWELHTDPIMVRDSAAATLLTIQYNLCAGTLAMFAVGRPDIAEVLEQLLAYRISGQFCLTELGHGLDAFNLQTTATLRPDGGFELNTPVEHAAKFMPPTAPCGIPMVAVVFARLIVGNEDRGVKPFLTPLSDGNTMYDGIACRVLSQRGGTQPLHHALTHFHRVHLPSTALLGSMKKSSNPREAFFYHLSRVITGTLLMGGLGVAALRVASYVAGRYSFRRLVTDPMTGTVKPIIAFSTQQVPLITALAQSFVLEAFSERAYALFVEAKSDLFGQHFIATVLKVTVVQHALNAILVLGDRCGAQGLFEINQLSSLHASVRGASIADGDILTISIRFAMDVLLDRIAVPVSPNPESLLARHEQSIINDLRATISTAPHHRDPELQDIILPQCQTLIEAIGHRIAYDAAVRRDLDQRIIDVYVASVVKLDSAWYAENGISRAEQRRMEYAAVRAAVQHVPAWLERLGLDSFVVAPMVSDARWEEYVQSLEVLGSSRGRFPSVVADTGVGSEQRALQPQSFEAKSHL